MSGSDTPDNQRGTVTPQQLLGTFAGGGSGTFTLPANCETLLIAGPGTGVGTLTSVVGATTGTYYPFATIAAAPGSSAGPTYLVSVWPALDSSVVVTADSGAATWYVIADASPRGAGGGGGGSPPGTGELLTMSGWLDPAAGMSASGLAPPVEDVELFPPGNLTSFAYDGVASAASVTCSTDWVFGNFDVAVEGLTFPSGADVNIYSWTLAARVLIYSDDGTQRILVANSANLTTQGGITAGDLTQTAWAVVAQQGTDLSLVSPLVAPFYPDIHSAAPASYAYGAVAIAQANPERH